MKSLTKILILGVLLVFASVNINAQTKQKKQKVQFGKIDSNKDGKISVEEYDVFVNAYFEKKDLNKDAKLDASECKIQKKFDLNKDGFITKEEFLEVKKSSFQKKDNNKDGFLSKKEFQGNMKKMLNNPSKCGGK